MSYDKLSEAERASVESRLVKSQDEAEFVLKTFQSVVAQLQNNKELERLSEQAAERASSAESSVSELLQAFLPADCFRRQRPLDNQPSRNLLEVDGKAPASHLILC